MTVVICIAFALMCVFYLIFERMKFASGSGRAPRIAVKCAATSMAVIVALLGCLKSGTAPHWIMLMGLIAGTVADGVLCVNFVAGGGVFALGHALYITAFLMMRRPGWYSWLILLAMLGLTAAAFIRFRKGLGRRSPHFIAYAAFLSLMVACSSAQYPVYFIGALLFAFSDCLLGYQMMTRHRVKMSYISLGAYYLGQFLLGLGVFLR